MDDKTNKLSEKLKNVNIEMREEIIYAEVFAEIKSGYRRDGLWAKALSKCDGDEKKTEALYIKYRAKILDEEVLKYDNEEQKLNEAKHKKRMELVQEEDGAFAAYLQQDNNEKKKVNSKNFFNSSSRLRFWITLLPFFALVQQVTMTSQTPIYAQSIEGMGISWLIILINIITWFARAKDAGINSLWVIGMFIPFLNFISFYLLGVTPSKNLKSE